MTSTLRGSIGRIVERRRRNGEEELWIDWQIRNFFSLNGDDGDFYESLDAFSFRKRHWRLHLFPSSSSEGGVQLRLVRTDKGAPKEAIRTTIGIKGWVDRGMKEGVQLYLGCEAYVWPVICLRSDLWREKSSLMPSDLLTFVCTLEINKPILSSGISLNQDASVKTHSGLREPNALTSGSRSTEKKDASSQTDDIEFLPEEKSSAKQDASSQTDDKNEAFPERKESSAKQGTGNDIGKDIGKLLASGESSDLVVQVREVQFKVHRAILSVRSPVLSAIFRHDTAEKASNRISISDCEPDVFGEFLQYLYTGSVEVLNGENVFKLYRVADKYLADDLKLQCLRHVRDTLCVETFCNALQLALTYGESDLLELAIDFASKNFQSVLCSVQWQNFICEYPREANEVLIKCYNPRN